MAITRIKRKVSVEALKDELLHQGEPVEVHYEPNGSTVINGITETQESLKEKLTKGLTLFNENNVLTLLDSRKSIYRIAQVYIANAGTFLSYKEVAELANVVDLTRVAQARSGLSVHRGMVFKSNGVIPQKSTYKLTLIDILPEEAGYVIKPDNAIEELEEEEVHEVEVSTTDNLLNSVFR